jgi:hypothetical protein
MTLHITAMQGEDVGVWAGFGFVFYFLPFMIAVLRQNGREGFVLLVNALVGWTVAGWFVAMNLALHDERSPRPKQPAPGTAAARRARRRALYSTSNLSTFSS